VVPRALTIATSDSGGGAGVQADLKAFAAAGAHGMSAVVALTAQNTTDVTAIHELPPEFVVAQLDAVFSDLGVDAAKTGMLFSRRLIETVADYLEDNPVPLVVDPVLVASSGAQLLEDGAVGALVARLFPLATVVTPNLHEAETLAGGRGSRSRLAYALHELGAAAVIVTGGHGEPPIDLLYDGHEFLEIPVDRYSNAATHGAGCTHSATLAPARARPHARGGGSRRGARRRRGGPEWARRAGRRRGSSRCAERERRSVNAGESLRLLREQRPLVHQITNYVVMNETANATLAVGALPVMAHAREEVEEMAGIASALVLNIGTLSPHWVDAMLAAGTVANERGVPVVLDPVGAGATRYRTETAQRILDSVSVAVLRGNAGEIATLVGVAAEVRGVESIDGGGDAKGLAREAARTLGLVAAVTGPVDFVSDGDRTVAVANGHPLLGSITGTGCMASALTGCFLAVAGSPLAAAAEALVAFGVAGEDAAVGAQGPGSFHVNLYDALAALDPETLDERAQLS